MEYTRTTDIYQTPFQKASIANQSGADYFVSFHRNSSPIPGQYTGVETLVYNKSGSKYDMAENIAGALGELGFQNLGVKERPGLVVLRRTAMPSVLIEAGFLNNDQDNAMFDEKFDEIAQAIASAILGTLGEEDVTSPTYYRVQAGAFKNRQYADQLLYELLDQGYPAFLLDQDGYFKVQVGAYLQLGNAIAMEQRLRDAGYSTLITTK